MLKSILSIVLFIRAKCSAYTHNLAILPIIVGTYRHVELLNRMLNYNIGTRAVENNVCECAPADRSQISEFPTCCMLRVI